jgi:hypothetical protein
MESIVSVSYGTSILLHKKMLDIAIFEKGYEKAATGSAVCKLDTAFHYTGTGGFFNSRKMFDRLLPIQL